MNKKKLPDWRKTQLSKQRTEDYKAWKRKYDRERYLKNGSPCLVHPENLGTKGPYKVNLLNASQLQAFSLVNSAIIESFQSVLFIIANESKTTVPPSIDDLVSFIKVNLYKAVVKAEIVANAKTPTKRRKTLQARAAKKKERDRIYQKSKRLRGILSHKENTINSSDADKGSIG